jgi:hypothetical protein
MRGLFILFVISLFVVSCKHSIDTDYIKSTGWAYSEGYRVTDFLTFDASGYYSIRHDTLFIHGKPRAVIIDLDKESYDLTIRSLDGKKEGHYMDEREMFH